MAQPDSRAADLVLRNCLLPDRQEPVDIIVDGGEISDITAAATRPARTVLDVGGKLVTPAFVDGQIYLDKVFLGERASSGPVAFGEQDLVAATYREASAGNAFSAESICERARRVLRQAVRHGTTAVRGVADVFPEIGTSRVELLLGLKQEFAPYLDLQIFAYPQFGILKSPGTLELLDKALSLGADGIAGVPAFDNDGERHIALLFELAERRGCPLHFSLDMDLPGEITAEGLELWQVAHRALASGLNGRITLGHLCALSTMAPREADRAVELIHRAGFHVLVFASSQLWRLGRTDRAGARRGLTRIKELLAAGVNVAYASNDIRDAFNPFGNADMLLEGLITAQAAQLGRDDELATVFAMGTENAARALGIEHRYGIAPGKRADLVVLDATLVVDAVRSQAEKLYVIKRGEVIASNRRICSAPW
jgi:cytosine deaminase